MFERLTAFVESFFYERLQFGAWPPVGDDAFSLFIVLLR